MAIGTFAMKLGAVTMAYRDQETIRGTLSCLAPFVSKHIVMINEHPYYGQYEPHDNTEKICQEFDNVVVIKGDWPEHELRNIGVQLCKDCDWMIGFDSDEMMTSQDIVKLTQHLEQTQSNLVGFVSKTYWHSTDYIFSPDPDHIKVCVVRTNSAARYTNMQCVSEPFDVLHYRQYPFITHHHLSWCAPKNILRKVLCCNHANDYDGQAWYDKYYRNWKEGDVVYQPHGTRWEAKKDPLPDELKILL